jgi:hypothetical protein
MHRTTKAKSASALTDAQERPIPDRQELSTAELDQVSGGLKKLPGKKKPPTLVLD